MRLLNPDFREHTFGYKPIDSGELALPLDTRMTVYEQIDYTDQLREGRLRATAQYVIAQRILVDRHFHESIPI
ncbi:MAG TPA: hypothetical protein VIM37_00980 [Candidatus Microsaccharimonas sp.]|jgi:hypothetical protein